jgi:transcriptional regulator with PAS, ATPase and Fis domain
MIYGQKAQQPIPDTQQESASVIAEKIRKLKALVANDNEGQLTDSIVRWINDNKLPFTYEKSLKEGKYELKNILSRGEQFLQQFITVDDAMLSMKKDVRKMAQSNHDVLITGETGTGKEIIARSMIGNREGQILSINCAGLPENLIESELFGHRKGSFTGAESDKKGLFVAAQDGIVFLDEINRLPLHLQSKLLRALQDKKVRPVGSNKEEDINCKFVCASNQNLLKLYENGLFQGDLYARISMLEVDLSPLKERMCDVVPIAESIAGGAKFLERYRDDLTSGKLDLQWNVRSIQRHITRYNVLGRL